MTPFRSTHNLKFESAEWVNPIGIILNADEVNPWLIYRVGTCHGQWRSTRDAYEILTVINEVPGNGHLQDVLEWFEQSCRRDKKDLVVREMWNRPFMEHLIAKRGFVQMNEESVIKHFK